MKGGISWEKSTRRKTKRVLSILLITEILIASLTFFEIATQNNDLTARAQTFIGPKDHFAYGNMSEILWFNLTIENRMDVGDLFEILNETLPLPENWIVEIFLDDKITMIQDSDGDGIPDIWIDAHSQVDIYIKLTLPSVFPPGDYNNITITVISNTYPSVMDNTSLQARIYPYIAPEKQITPSSVYIKGTGYDDEATIELKVTGRGFPTKEPVEQDVIFAIDISGSMSESDVIMAQVGAKEYVNQLKSRDMAAVMYWSSDWLLWPFFPYYNPYFLCENALTSDYNQVIGDLSKSIPLGGATYTGSAINGCNDEFIDNGNISHFSVIILLSDGGWNGGNNLWDAVNRAKENGIVIFTIGFGTLENEDELRQIADETGGEYFYAEKPEDVIDVYLTIADRVSQLAGYDIDITDSSPMIRDVLPPWIEFNASSFSIQPDSIYTNATGYTFLEWNITKISIDETWSVRFNITSSNLLTWHANDFTTSRVSYTNWHDDTMVILFPETYITAIVGEPSPPELFIQVLPNGRMNDIKLSWIPPHEPGVTHYLIYKSQDQTNFDFTDVWIDTSKDVDPLDCQIIPLRTTFSHPGAAMPGHENYSQELYYTIRAVNCLGEISDTSRTVGKWTNTFQQGTSTFSMPLQPLQIRDTDHYTIDMNANYIKFVNTTSHTWVQHNLGDGPVNNMQMMVGKGFEVDFTATTKYTFTGMPGAMMLYDNVSFGFDATPGSGYTNCLTAKVEGDSNSITLNWTQPGSMTLGDRYYVLRSNKRDGFWGTLGVDYEQIATLPLGTLSYTDIGNAISGTEYYYMIMPINLSTNERGVSSYSIGVWTAGYQDEYDTFALPLKPTIIHTMDWYCDNIENTVGVNFFEHFAQRWGWHSTRMPADAFDPIIEMGAGYQVSTSSFTKFSFVGV